jgi:type I restriction enzyme, S subunit
MTEGGLPDGWTEIELAKVLQTLEDGRDLHHGWSPQCERLPAADGEWGVLKTTAIQDGRFLPEHNKKLPPQLSPRPQLEVREGDILITCAGPRARCGVACLVPNARPRLMLSGKMYRFRPRPSLIESSYLAGWLRSPAAQREIDRMKTGISDSGLNLTHDRFRRLKVPLAPLGEQRRIISKLEELFSDLDAGIAALERSKAKLARYRAAVHEAAVEGNLTAEWRRQNESRDHHLAVVAEIVAKRLVTWGARGEYAEVAAPRATTVIPESWTVTSLDALLREPLRNGRSAKPPSDAKGVRVLTLTAVTEDDFSERNTKLAAVQPDQAEPLWLERGDILVERSNTPELVGTAAMYRGDPRYAIYPDLMIRVRVDQAVNNDYIALVLRSPSARQYFKDRARGIAGSMPKIDHETVRGCPVPLPPRPEQDRIVAAVHALIGAADRLSDEINAGLRRAAVLKQSLLSTAFSGGLCS